MYILSCEVRPKAALYKSQKSMAEGKQLDLVLRDMLFVTWAVEPERARKLVPERLELDTRTDEAGRAMAFVSAVCFRVADVRSSMLLLPALNFEQLNYRAYVKDGDRPAVCFLDMKVNSRMVTSLTSFLSVPIQYEDIDIKVSKPEFLGDAPEAQSYSVKSAGFQVDASIEGSSPSEGSDIGVEFVTDRWVGYMCAGDGVFKIKVEQPGLKCFSARVDSLRTNRLEELGLLNSGGATPRSALYVREAPFGAEMPRRAW